MVIGLRPQQCAVRGSRDLQRTSRTRIGGAYLNVVCVGFLLLRYKLHPRSIKQAQGRRGIGGVYSPLANHWEIGRRYDPVCLLQITPHHGGINENTSEVPLELLKFGKLAPDSLVQNTPKLFPPSKNNSLLYAGVDVVVFLQVQAKSVQCLLRNANVLTDAHHRCPVNYGHRCEQCVRGEGYEQQRHSHQPNKRSLSTSTTLSHKSPFESLPQMTSSPVDVPSRAGRWLPAQITPGAPS